MKRKYVNEKFKAFIHGADYNPEQWMDCKEIWDEDMRLMHLANTNEMSVGIFSWAKLEPREGEYDFSFLDEIIDKIDKNGGKVVLATPSCARPRWLAEKYPEVLRVNNNNVRMHFGERHNHCYTSPAYRKKVNQINTLLAERYGKHPAVIAWHISNEYGGACFCPLCQDAFREYLRKKYDNDIEKLNKAYWTTFWSHNYDNFEQIEPPMSITDYGLHGLNLDWRRFVTHQTVDFMKAEIQPLKKICPDIPVTTNMMPGAYTTNYYEFANELDVISWDSYPDWKGGNEEYFAVDTAFWHDYFRALKQRPFMLMESAPALVNWKEYNKLKRPGMDVLASLQAVSHGSDSVQYFQWRKSRGSVEKFHGAVVDHLGTEDTRIFKEISKTGARLKAIEEVAGSCVDAKVAILIDWENMWALDDSQGFHRNDKKYIHTCLTYYKALWKKAISVDVISSHADLSKYDLVIAPMLYLLSETQINAFANYVQNGGRLYATYMLGMVNETDLCYLGGFPAGKLKDVFGILNEEIDTLYPEDKVSIAMQNGQTFTGIDYSEIVHLRGAKALANYASEFYAGQPAFTVNEYGKGKAYYQAFRDDGTFTETVLWQIICELGIKPNVPIPAAGLPDGVTAQVREDDTVKYLFVENFSPQVQAIALDSEYINLETGERATQAVLEGYSVQIFKKNK